MHDHRGKVQYVCRTWGHPNVEEIRDAFVSAGRIQHNRDWLYPDDNDYFFLGADTLRNRLLGPFGRTVTLPVEELVQVFEELGIAPSQEEGRALLRTLHRAPVIYRRGTHLTMHFDHAPSSQVKVTKVNEFGLDPYYDDF